MSFAFKPPGGAWIEISEAGTLLPGGGENGEDVRLSQAFVLSLGTPQRLARGFYEVGETEAPDGAIGWTIEDADGLPVRAWILPE
jgi:hypothetical protein